MVKEVLYIDYCYMALIPIGRTERIILDQLTNKNGWFDEDAYLEKMSEALMYVTKNQKELLNILPQRYEGKRKRKRRLKALGQFLGETYFNNRFSVQGR